MHPTLPPCSPKRLLLVAFWVATVCTTSAFAQQTTPLQRTCSAMEVLAQQVAENPARAKSLQAIERQLSQFQEQQRGAAGSASVITIPVVVHVVYRNSAENISEAQIRSQLKVLNADFRRANADADNTWPQADDMQIEFKLATVDPDGKPTGGITRTYTSTSSFSTSEDVKFTERGGKTAWPASSYLNLWVCNLSGNLLGYAQFPGGSASTDGVVLDHEAFGTSGTALPPFNLGRTATHEVGHWLNLRHIWGDGDCSIDDHVADTPPADAANYGCALGKKSCNATNMVQNYMDYSDDACMNLFTAGQKTRMRALFAPGGARASLLQSAGLGTPDGTEPPACTANALTLTLVLDGYPAETSWQLKNQAGAVLAAGDKYTSPGSTITETFCLPAGCYDFVIMDAFGDGICCTYGRGSYSLTDAGGEVLASGYNFGKRQTKSICLGSSPPASCPALDFSAYTIKGFAGHDFGTHQVQNSGTTLMISGNSWKQIPYNYTVTPNTVLEFEFRSTQQGEIQGISFEDDNSISPERSFRVYGTQNWGIGNYDTYIGTSWKKYTIPVGTFFTGSFTKLVFMGDDDVHGRQTGYYRHVKIYEGACGTTRLADVQSAGPLMLGRDGDAEGGIRLYPNPARESIQVVWQGEQTAPASLYNLQGQCVWQGRLQQGTALSIPLSGLPGGMYTLRAISASGASYHQRFVKQ